MNAANVTFHQATPIFFVPDRKRVLDYYRQLGFHCDDDMGFVERGGFALIVHESPTATGALTNNPVCGDNALDAFAMVSGINDLFADFRSRGAAFLYELRTNEYQMREFAIADPAGYTIGFGESLV